MNRWLVVMCAKLIRFAGDALGLAPCPIKVM